MRYTYYERGKCRDCADVMWIMVPENRVICPCYEASIKGSVLTNMEDITDEEHLVAIRKEFWWLGDITVDDTITLIKG